MSNNRLKGVRQSDVPTGSGQASDAIFAASSQPTDMYTYFTQPGGTLLLYSASRWTLARLWLENAGPVSVGTRAQLQPVLSGKGPLLVTNVEFKVTLAPGNRLYIAATAINRVKVVFEPFAWQAQLLAALGGPS